VKEKKPKKGKLSKRVVTPAQQAQAAHVYKQCLQLHELCPTVSIRDVMSNARQNLADPHAMVVAGYNWEPANVIVLARAAYLEGAYTGTPGGWPPLEQRFKQDFDTILNAQVDTLSVEDRRVREQLNAAGRGNVETAVNMTLGSIQNEFAALVALMESDEEWVPL
jgi:hypothetical protein